MKHTASKNFACYLQWTTWCYMPEDTTLQRNCCGNLKYYTDHSPYNTPLHKQEETHVPPIASWVDTSRKCIWVQRQGPRQHRNTVSKHTVHLHNVRMWWQCSLSIHQAVTQSTQWEKIFPCTLCPSHNTENTWNLTLTTQTYILSIYETRMPYSIISEHLSNEVLLALKIKLHAHFGLREKLYIVFQWRFNLYWLCVIMQYEHNLI